MTCINFDRYDFPVAKEMAKVTKRMEHLEPLLRSNLLMPGAQAAVDAEGKEVALPKLPKAYPLRWRRDAVAPKLSLESEDDTGMSSRSGSDTEKDEDDEASAKKAGEDDIIGVGDNEGAEKNDDEAKQTSMTKAPQGKSSLKDSKVKGGSRQRGRQALWRTAGTLGRGAIRKN